MISFVVSDMDGTLIKKGESFIPESLARAIDDLQGRGIIFAVASGRSYADIYNMMKENDNIYYICSDGGCIVYRGEVIYKRVIDSRIIEKYKGKGNYSFHTVPFGNEAIKIIKQGVLFSDTPDNCYEIYRDKDWREWVSIGTCKGAATEYLQKTLNIKTTETAAFGDNLNDLSMLRRAGYKYIMKNSPLSLRGVCGTTISDIAKAFCKISDKRGD